MLEWRAEPGGDQQRAELVAVQRGGVRLIVQARPPDMGGRGVIEEFFLDRVLIEPGDGAQPAGDGGTSTSPGFQIAAKAFDVGAADGEQGQGAGAAPGGELTQVQRVRLAGQPAVPGQETSEGEAFGIGEWRLDGNGGSGGGRGHPAPPGRDETREAARAPGAAGVVVAPR